MGNLRCILIKNLHGKQPLFTEAVFHVHTTVLIRNFFRFLYHGFEFTQKFYDLFFSVGFVKHQKQK